MKLLSAVVKATSGPPSTKNMIRPAMMVETVGTIIIGMSAWAHFGTFRYFSMARAM